MSAKKTVNNNHLNNIDRSSSSQHQDEGNQQQPRLNSNMIQKVSSTELKFDQEPATDSKSTNKKSRRSIQMMLKSPETIENYKSLVEQRSGQVTIGGVPNHNNDEEGQL